MSDDPNGNDVQRWELPDMALSRNRHGRSPFVGIPIRKEYDLGLMKEEFRYRWFNHDSQVWRLPILERREWYNEISRNFETWLNYITMDSTPEFYMNIRSLKRRGGILVGINGKKGSGKSWLAQMVITRLVETVPTVLFQYKDLESHVDPTQNGAEIGVLIDEDLKATGNESRNLVIHVNNIWETNRKAILSGVCTGVNLNFEGWGDTLDMRLTPIGVHEESQSTRFAMFDKKNHFLGLAAIQRKHPWDGEVMYYSEEGVWGEYQARAEVFSRSVTQTGGAVDAVDANTQTRHVEQFKDFLRDYAKTAPLPTKQILLRRLYRQAKLPAKSVGYMKEIIEWAREEIALEDDELASTDTMRVIPSGEGWTDLRTALAKVTKSDAFALYHVPPTPKMTYGDVGKVLGLDILPDSIGKNIRNERRRLKTTKLGAIGERFLASWIDSFNPKIAGGVKGEPDILCQVGDSIVALNVKLTLSDHFREHIPTTPEDQWIPHAYAVLLLPRLLEVRLYPITGSGMTLNSRGGVLSTIEEVAETVSRLVREERD